MSKSVSRKPKSLKPISLNPIKFDEAISDILKVKPKGKEAKGRIIRSTKAEAEEDAKNFKSEGFEVRVVKTEDGKYAVLISGKQGEHP